MNHDWNEYQRAVQAIAAAPADVARRHTETANDRQEHAHRTQRQLNDLVIVREKMTKRIQQLDQAAGEALTRHRASPEGPLTGLAEKPVTSIEDVHAQADELTAEIATISKRLDDLDHHRGLTLHRAAVLAVYAAPALLATIATRLTHGGWQIPLAAAVLVIAAMLITARKTKTRTTIWPPVIAGGVAGILVVGTVMYSGFTATLIGYGLIALILAWIALRRRR